MEPGVVERIHALWDGLDALAARDVDGAVTHLAAGLAELVGAGNAVWVAGVRMQSHDHRDPLRGWRAPLFHHLKPLPDWLLNTREIQRMWEKRRMDPSFLLGVANTGKYRCYSFRRSLPEDWFQSPYYRHYWERLGIHDVAVACCPVNAHAEVHYLFHRTDGAEPYGQGELDALGTATRGLRWFHARLLLSHGLPVAEAPFTLAERKVLKGLLGDGTEKEIAQVCGMSPATVHYYAGEIYRKLGVRGRAGLMSLWLQ
ncbi:helix-turn-helix domain-containing protein [Pseudothauera nasutitermitis]|nr:helix-turn-helix transcriptional regulator [Pseudothauera nasutitermitis]